MKNCFNCKNFKEPNYSIFVDCRKNEKNFDTYIDLTCKDESCEFECPKWKSNELEVVK